MPFKKFHCYSREVFIDVCVVIVLCRLLLHKFSTFWFMCCECAWILHYFASHFFFVRLSRIILQRWKTRLVFFFHLLNENQAKMNDEHTHTKRHLYDFICIYQCASHTHSQFWNSNHMLFILRALYSNVFTLHLFQRWRQKHRQRQCQKIYQK